MEGALWLFWLGAGLVLASCAGFLFTPRPERTLPERGPGPEMLAAPGEGDDS